MPRDEIELMRELYKCFNARDIDGVLVALAADVAWANGMDGGYVHGHEGLREYWTRQWAMVSPFVEPVALKHTEDGAVAAEVIQTVFDLNGQPLSGQTHGLKDKTVIHQFRFEGDKIKRFDIQQED